MALPWIRCTDYLFRGPQPRAHEWEALEELGIRTVVNLRDEEPGPAPGLRTVSIPVVDGEVPEPGQVQQFLALLEDPSAHPVYVHCLGGVGRTGIFVTCYRIHRGMPLEEALRLNTRELLATGSDLTPLQEQFVRDYFS